MPRYEWKAWVTVEAANEAEALALLETWTDRIETLGDEPSLDFEDSPPEIDDDEDAS